MQFKSGYPVGSKCKCNNYPESIQLITCVYCSSLFFTDPSYQLLQTLHHPNIVTLYGMSVRHTSLDTKTTFVMENYICSLSDHLADVCIKPSPKRSSKSPWPFLVDLSGAGRDM
jgi:hypothetical protein